MAVTSSSVGLDRGHTCCPARVARCFRAARKMLVPPRGGAEPRWSCDSCGWRSACAKGARAESWRGGSSWMPSGKWLSVCLSACIHESWSRLWILPRLWSWRKSWRSFSLFLWSASRTTSWSILGACRCPRSRRKLPGRTSALEKCSLCLIIVMTRLAHWILWPGLVQLASSWRCDGASAPDHQGRCGTCWASGFLVRSEIPGCSGRAFVPFPDKAVGPQQPLQTQALSCCAFSRLGLVQFLDQFIDVPVAVLVRFGVEKETVVLRSCSSSTGDVALRAARWNFWTLFLENFSDSPSCRGYASVLEAFGRISQLFLSWSCRATLGLTVDTHSSSACGWLWKNFRFFYVIG